MKYVFTAVFTPEDNDLYSIHFPDLPQCYTSGKGIADAIYMAQDVLNLSLYDMEQDNIPIPPASKPNDIETTGGQFTSIIAVDTDEYHRFYNIKSVKKTLTIPMWLNEQAQRANINYSHVLQEALKSELQVHEAPIRYKGD